MAVFRNTYIESPSPRVQICARMIMLNPFAYYFDSSGEDKRKIILFEEDKSVKIISLTQLTPALIDKLESYGLSNFSNGKHRPHYYHTECGEEYCLIGDRSLHPYLHRVFNIVSLDYYHYSILKEMIDFNTLRDYGLWSPWCLLGSVKEKRELFTSVGVKRLTKLLQANRYQRYGRLLTIEEVVDSSWQVTYKKENDSRVIYGCRNITSKNHPDTKGVLVSIIDPVYTDDYCDSQKIIISTWDN